MYVQSNGAILEIPHELFDPLNMTRLGPNLTADQQAVLVLWATANPDSPAINRE